MSTTPSLLGPDARRACAGSLCGKNMRMVRTFATVAFFFAAVALAQSSNAQTGTGAQNAQGSVAPQAPGGPQDAGGPVVIGEGPVGTLSGAQNTFTVLFRNQTDLEHATDPNTGRNFNWDQATNQWVNSATGQSYHSAGYLCSTSGPSAPSSATPQPGPATQGQPNPTARQQSQPKPSPSSSQTSKSTTGAGIQFQLRGFGGVSFINGNTPATAGFDGAVLFPLGNHLLVGPTAGFEWVNSSIVGSIGSMMPGSTFENTSVGFKNGNFGGTIGFPFGGWQLGVQGGATVAGSSITQQSGFCGLGNATSPAGCTVLSTTTTHDTVVGPFVGGYVSRSIFSHVGVFVRYDYFRPAEFKSSVSTLDLHYSDWVAGFNFTFGHH